MSGRLLKSSSEADFQYKIMSDQKLPMTFWLTLILLHHMSSETMSKLIDGSKMKNVISNIIENSLGATQFQVN